MVESTGSTNLKLQELQQTIKMFVDSNQGEDNDSDYFIESLIP